MKQDNADQLDFDSHSGLRIVEGQGARGDDAAAQFREAMRGVAAAYERALAIVSHHHPERQFLLQSCRDARECAELPPLAAVRDAS